MIVFARFGFEGAHRLPRVPEGHKCGRLHGHNWTVEIHCEGEPDDDTGFVIDFYAVEEAWKRRVYDVLDHRYLNDVAGLENPTTENMAMWMWAQLKREVPSLHRIVIHETPQFGVVYEGR
jgi:6-pyruvoyltetrahydropterin/6-carboxytetrahydropterin synthase